MLTDADVCSVPTRIAGVCSTYVHPLYGQARANDLTHTHTHSRLLGFLNPPQVSRSCPRALSLALSLSRSLARFSLSLFLVRSLSRAPSLSFSLSLLFSFSPFLSFSCTPYLSISLSFSRSLSFSLSFSLPNIYLHTLTKAFVAGWQEVLVPSCLSI
jgi:hypothetical protein